MVSRDSQHSASEIQAEIYRQMKPAERLRIAMEMSEFARSLSRAGLRSRRPELTEAELDEEMIYLMYGVRIARK